MKNLGRYLLVIILSVIVLQAGSVRAFVSDSNIELGENVVLHIKAQGDDIEFPTINEIGGYKVESVSSGTSYSVSSINGQSSSTKEESRSLVFTPDKDMTIPSIEVKVDGKLLQTAPIEIQVVAQSNQQNIQKTPDNPMDATPIATLSLMPSKSEAYVGESIIATLYFRHRRDTAIAKSEYQQPSFDGFLTKEIGGVKEYSDGSYDVKELNYLLIPLNSGKIDVDAAKLRFTRYLQANTQDMFDIFFKKASTKTIASNPFSIEVKPLLKDFNLVGDFTIGASIDKDEYEVNKPVELSITLKGYGAIESINFSAFDALNGVSVYKDEPIKEESIKDGRLYTSYHQKIVFVSDRDFSIPSVDLNFFNPYKEEEQFLKTEPFFIKLKGAISHDKETIKKEDATQKEIIYQASSLPYWLGIMIFFTGVIVGILSLLLYSFLKRKKENMMSNDTLLSRLYPYISKDKEIEAFVRELYAKKAGDKSIKIDKKRVKKILESLKKYQ
jgi:hypothetical protein